MIFLYSSIYSCKPVWRNGRRGRLKIYSRQLGAGSSPVTGNSPDKLSSKRICPVFLSATRGGRQMTSTPGNFPVHELEIYRAHKTFMTEIKGAGLCWEFTATSIDTFQKYHLPKHLEEPRHLLNSICRFKEYTDILRQLVNHPVGNRETPREISPKLIEIYDTFSNALNEYATTVQAVNAGQATRDTLVETATKVCALSRHLNDPTQEHYLRTTTPRGYLEDARRILRSGDDPLA